MRSASLLLFVSLVACGGNVAVDRTSATSTTSSGAGGGVTTATATATSTGVGGGSSTTTTSDTSTGSTGTGTVTGTTTTTDTGTTTGTITGTTTTTSGGLLCGMSACNPGDQCCWSSQASDGKCQANGDPCGGQGSTDARIACMVPSDCPGQICCGRRSQDPQNPHYRRVDCRDTCDMPDVTICDPGSPDPKQCPPTMNGQPGQCQPSDLLPKGYFVCSQQ